MEMEDPNVILIVRTDQSAIERALELPHNSDRYVPERSYIESRQATPYADSDSDSDSHGDSQQGNKKGPYLRITFDRPPINIGKGFSFGTAKETCDILLGENSRQDNISGIHFYITFNENGYLILVGESDTQGTAVSYNGWGSRHRRRRGFRWILFPDKKVQVHLPNKFTLKLAFPTHQTCEAKYRENIALYLKKSRAALPPFRQLTIGSPDHTALPSEPLSPKHRPIYLPSRILGTGSFGKVFLVTDVSTAGLYAAKVFGKPHEFKNEVDIMRGIVHRHIVRFMDYVDRHTPQLIMEYLSLGNLEQENRCHRITPEETSILLFQCLQALGYLHRKGITHRDLKPANILVESRHPFHVKLCDFGFAKVVDDDTVLRTFCGTHAYCAPEIYLGGVYSPAVDLWSLGVIALEYAYGLSYQGLKIDRNDERMRRYGIIWCKDIVRQANDWGSDPLIDLLATGLLKINPKERLPTDECLSRVEQNLSFQVDRFTVEGGTSAPQTFQMDGDDRASAVPGALWGSKLSYGGSRLGHPIEKSTLQKRQLSPSRSSTPRASSVSRMKRLQRSTTSTYSLNWVRGSRSDLLLAKDIKQAVRAMLNDISKGSTLHETRDTSDLISFICEDAKRLGFARFNVTEESGYITVSGFSGSGSQLVANFSEEDCAGTTISIACHILRGLRRLVRQGTPNLPTVDPPERSTAVHNLSMRRVSVINNEDEDRIPVMPGSPQDDRRAQGVCKPRFGGANAQMDERIGGESQPENRRAHDLCHSQIVGEGRSKEGAPVRSKSQFELEEFVKLDAHEALEHAEKGCCFVRDLFLQLRYGERCISIRKADFRLNAAHILSAIGIPQPDAVTRQFRQTGVPYDVVKGGRKGFQGTYIDFEMGLQWCRDYTVKDLEDLLLDLLKAYRRHLEELNQPTHLLPNVPLPLSSPGYQTTSVSEPEPPRLDVAAQGHASYLSCGPSPPLIEGSCPPQLPSSAMLHRHLQSSVVEEATATLYGDGNAENRQANTQELELVQKRSVFTEPSYSHGSYLPRIKDQSYALNAALPSGPTCDYGKYRESNSFLSPNMDDEYVFDKR